MIALRILCPGGLAGDVLALLDDEPGATHVVHLPGAARTPPGDLVEADLARECASAVTGRLGRLPGSEDCAITLHDIETTVSRYAKTAEDLAPGLGVDAVVWEEVEARTGDESALSVSFAALLVLATLIAAVGVLLDSSILIVGAMVVGPEFGPVMGLTVAAVERRWGLARRSLIALGVGFPLAVAATVLLTLAVRATAGLPAAYAGEQRPLTAFISRPDGYALVVALLAGVAGVIALTSAKSGALVGVAVSVTTVPAAADVGVAAAAGNWSECGGAAAQLGVNLVALVVAGAVTLHLRTGRAGRVARPGPAARS